MKNKDDLIKELQKQIDNKERNVVPVKPKDSKIPLHVDYVDFGKVKKKRKKWPIILVIIIIIVCISECGSISDYINDYTDTSDSQQQEEYDGYYEDEEYDEFSSIILKAYTVFGNPEDQEADYAYELTAKAKEFIPAHEELFPAKNKELAAKYTNSKIKYKHIIKSPEDYGDKLIKLENYEILQISEIDWEYGEHGKLTHIEAHDGYGGNAVSIFYFNKTNLYKDDRITIYALPLDTTSWENIGGGTTLAIALAGSYIEKL